MGALNYHKPIDPFGLIQGQFYFLFNFVVRVNFISDTVLGPEVYSASNRNEYQKHKNNKVSGE
jgi:hypothetical protein